MALNSRSETRVRGIRDGRRTAWIESLRVTSDGEETVSPARSPTTPAHGLLTTYATSGYS